MVRRNIVEGILNSIISRTKYILQYLEWNTSPDAEIDRNAYREAVKALEALERMDRMIDLQRIQTRKE